MILGERIIKIGFMIEFAEMFLRLTRRKIPKGEYNHFL
jgi:hypothetical protein